MHKFGIWAPNAQKISLQWSNQTLPMNGPNKRGWWTLEVPGAQCGDRYAFLLDDDPNPYPDPRGLRQPGNASANIFQRGLKGREQPPIAGANGFLLRLGQPAPFAVGREQVLLRAHAALNCAAVQASVSATVWG